MGKREVKSPEIETVTISRNMFNLLNESFCQRMCWDREMAETFTKEVLAGDDIKVSQDGADNIVASADLHGGRQFANLVGSYFNDPDLAKFSGRTFKQVCESVAGPVLRL